MSVYNPNMPGNTRSKQDPYLTGGRTVTTDHRRGFVTGGNQSWNILQNVDKHNGDPLIDLFQSFMMQGEFGWNAIETKDWNKEVLSAALQQYIVGLNNQYNEKLRDEQRAYDNPTSQLLRLTGAGIGRDAAIQLLSGAGAGAGAGAPYSTAPTLDAGSSPSESTLNAVQTGASLINSAIGLVNCGFSSALSFRQAQLLHTQQQMSQNQLDAYELSGDAYQLLSNEVRGGAISDDDGHLYDSVKNVADGIENLAKMGNLTAQDWHATGKIDRLRQLSPYAAPLLADFYRQSRSGQDHDVWFADEHAKAESLAAVQNMQVGSLAKGIEKMDQEIQNLIADEQWRRKTIDLIDGQLKLMEAQGEQAKASAAYQKALERKTQLENMQTNGWMSAMTDIPIQTSVGNGTIQVSGLKLFTTERLQNLKSNALVALSLNNEGYWKKNVQHQMQDVDNLISMSILDGLRTNTSLEVYNRFDDDQKQLIGLSDAYKHAGVFDYINASASSLRTRGPLGIESLDQPYYNRINGILFPKKTGNGHK